MEDLNSGFKNSRKKIEKQIYQKFEKMLIDKLNYLTFKERDINEPGGALNGYQLTEKFDSFEKLGKQSGVLFYVNAAYTSAIDPQTGFVKGFNTSGISSDIKKSEFLNKMSSITYDPVEDAFAFSFDYRDFPQTFTDYRNRWTIYTKGERVRYKDRKYIRYSPTDEIKNALQNANIPLDGELKEKIVSSKAVAGRVYDSFLGTLNMRFRDETEDYIISPVRNNKGEFYCSKNAKDTLPKDSDANGAYNIARKGMLLLRMIESERKEGDDKLKMPKMENKQWLAFVQSEYKTWKNQS